MLKKMNEKEMRNANGGSYCKVCGYSNGATQQGSSGYDQAITSFNRGQSFSELTLDGGIDRHPEGAEDVVECGAHDCGEGDGGCGSIGKRGHREGYREHSSVQCPKSTAEYAVMHCFFSFLVCQSDWFIYLPDFLYSSRAFLR